MASGSIKKDEATNTWYYVADVAKKGEPRKQKKKRGFKKKGDAQAALTALLNEVNSGEYIEASKIRFVDYMLDVWLKEKIVNNRMTRLTVDSYKSYIKNHIEPCLPKKTLADLDVNDIKKMVKHLKEKQDDEGNLLLSDSTVQRIFNIVNTALNSAVRDELIKENPAKKVDRPKIAKGKLRVWNAEECNKFLDSLEGNRNYLAFYLAIHTGMRQGEILGLPIENIDLENKVLRITQTLEHDGKGIKQGAKTNSGIRAIEVSDQVIEQIKIQLERIKQEKELAGEEYQDHGLLMCTNIGKPVFPDTLTKTMRRKIKQTELKPIRFHDLRHTAATLMLFLGVHPKVVSEILGHSSVTITMDTYSHLLPNMQAQATNSLSNLLSKREE